MRTRGIAGLAAARDRDGAAGHRASTTRARCVLQLNQTAASLSGLPVPNSSAAPQDMHPARTRRGAAADMQTALTAATVTKRGTASGGRRAAPVGRPLPAAGRRVDGAPDRCCSSRPTSPSSGRRRRRAWRPPSRSARCWWGSPPPDQEQPAGRRRAAAADRGAQARGPVGDLEGRRPGAGDRPSLRPAGRRSGPLRLASVVEAITGSVQRTFGRNIARDRGPGGGVGLGPAEAESIPVR